MHSKLQTAMAGVAVLASAALSAGEELDALGETTSDLSEETDSVAEHAERASLGENLPEILPEDFGSLGFLPMLPPWHGIASPPPASTWNPLAADKIRRKNNRRRVGAGR